MKIEIVEDTYIEFEMNFLSWILNLKIEEIFPLACVVKQKFGVWLSF